MIAHYESINVGPGFAKVRCDTVGLPGEVTRRTALMGAATENGDVVVINLPYRVDRKFAMERELNRIGWRAHFFPAVRPTLLNGFPSIGAHGCFLSHLAVLEEAAAASVAHLVIMEDDLSFSRHFREHWQAALVTLHRQDWSVFYPGHHLDILPPGISLLPPSTSVRCTHFMMIKGSAISVFIDGFKAILKRSPGHPLGGPMHVDGAYSTVRQQNPRLSTFAHFPPLAYQRPSRTDVGMVKWFDRIERLAPIVRLVRGTKAELMKWAK